MIERDSVKKTTEELLAPSNVEQYQAILNKEISEMEAELIDNWIKFIHWEIENEPKENIGERKVNEVFNEMEKIKDAYTINNIPAKAIPHDKDNDEDFKPNVEKMVFDYHKYYADTMIANPFMQAMDGTEVIINNLGDGFMKTITGRLYLVKRGWCREVK